MEKESLNPVNRKLTELDPAPAKAAGVLSGEFVTETFEYDGGRQVTVYVPPNPPEAIVLAGDGQRISKWGRLLEKAGLTSTMIVGVHGLTDEMLRLILPTSIKRNAHRSPSGPSNRIESASVGIGL